MKIEDHFERSKCPACVDHVGRNAKLLYDTDRKIGADGRYHWARVVGEATVIGHGFKEATPFILSVCGISVTAKG